MNEMFHKLAVEQPLRLVLPICYQHLLDQFTLYHLHPYDMKASVISENGGFAIMLRYGEGLTQYKKQLFEQEALENLTSESEQTQFYKESAEICKKAMIADYYKMMKP